MIKPAPYAGPAVPAVHTAQGEYEEIYPFTLSELRGLFTHPHRVVEMVFTHRQRLAANIAREHRLPLLVLGLLMSSLLLALPYGAVMGVERTSGALP